MLSLSSEGNEMLKNPVVVENQEQGKGAAIPVRQGRNFVVDDHQISRLFTGYFNNKMTLLLFLVQAKQLKPHSKLAATVRGFLDDLFHHMLEGPMQKRYRLTFKWLKLFFEKLPDVTVNQRDKAKEFIRAIYDAMGLHLKEDL